VTYRLQRAKIVAAAMAVLLAIPISAQSPIDVYELADYRLTTEVFERFVKANGPIVEIIGRDSTFTYAPLFTKELALSGDAVAEAAGLVARLSNHAGLAAALDAAKITPREYSKFVITLIVAHLAHGFVKAGVLPRVAPGAATTNVEFVKAHESDVTAALAGIGIRD
jgi:hypothetical protein